jgi:enterochelin esterase family protein
MKMKFGVMSLALVLTAFAQPPASTPGQAPGRGMMGGRGPALRSPEVLDDQKVTFRLRAPNASEVLLNGDWPQGRGVKLAKDDAGIWSATVGPLTPELWAYTFNVDGVSLLDPANANILRDGTRYSNFLIVDGALSDAYKIKDVPHGNLTLVWYDSPTLASASPRRMYVSTSCTAPAATKMPGTTWAAPA